MNASSTAGRLIVGLAVVALLGGCAPGANPTTTVAPTPTAPATATPAPTPGVVVATNLAYESANPVLVPGELDVYAPAAAGAWPVVVMFHGAPESDPKADLRLLAEQARRVAELGFVVFNASWGHGGAAYPPTYDELQAVRSQAACAVEFARAHAVEYGGDATTMIVFGHSGGAHAAALAAFTHPKPTVGCLGGPTLGAIDTLLTWEGNWLVSVLPPDLELATDPRVMDALTPWPYLAEHKDQKVVMLVSEDPDASLLAEGAPESIVERPVGDPWAADSWLAKRDPSGDLRRQLEANGAFADGTIGLADAQQLLYSVLKAQGNPVTLDVMPDSSHAWLAGKGWDVFLAAFPKAAAKVRPFHATLSGAGVTFDPVIPKGRCVEKAGVTDAITSSVARGEVTDLGPVNLVGEHCSDFDTGTYGDGRMTLTFANGDILKSTYAGGFTTAPCPECGFQDEFTFVDGGTGRFVFASGGGTDSGVFDTKANEWSLQMDGWISLGGG